MVQILFVCRKQRFLLQQCLIRPPLESRREQSVFVQALEVSQRAPVGLRRTAPSFLPFADLSRREAKDRILGATYTCTPLRCCPVPYS